MVGQNLSRQYNEVHMASMSSEETVLMLYDGVIRFLREAGEEIGRKSISSKVRLLEKVEKIIEYLRSCLDRENGGEIAENLNRLYEYMLLRLTEANLYNDTAKLGEIERLIATLREGWVTICDAAKKGQESPLQNEEGQATPKKIVVSI